MKIREFKDKLVEALGAVDGLEVVQATNGWGGAFIEATCGDLTLRINVDQVADDEFKVVVDELAKEAG